MFNKIKDTARIINPFAPEKITLTITVNPRTGQADFKSDVIVPVTSVIGILSGVIANLAAEMELQQTAQAKQSVMGGDNAEENDGNH